MKNLLERNRLIISASRVIERDKQGNPTRTIREHINLVHPEDDRGRDGQRGGLNGFRELGAMFKGNPDYINAEYTKLEAFV